MATAIGLPVRAPEWVVSIQGVDITTDISAMVRVIEYVDRIDSMSGEVEIEIEDHTKRWQAQWYPALGDQTELQIGYHGEALLMCGDFQIDDVELEGPPDVMRVRCLASYVTAAMRTTNTIGYENQSLEQIAATIAAKYGLELVSAPVGDEGEVEFARITQRRETDLEFLKRLAREHDYIFTVRGPQLIFYPRVLLDAAAPAATIMRSDTERFYFRNRTRRIYGGAQVSYFDPDAKQLITQLVVAPAAVRSADNLKIVTRVENGTQAFVKANAAMHIHNMTFVEASIDGPGRPELVAGGNVQVAGWGALDGIYQIETARHRIARASGYTTSIAARRVG